MKKPIFKRKWFIALIIIFGICLIGGCVGGEDLSEPPNDAAVATEEVAEDVPQEYQNALSKAYDYSDIMYMSKAGIYDQLTSEYGEGFPEDAAQYAIDNIDADWNYNALQTAKIYYEDMAMSKDAIYDQLISDYGEKFTKEQAQYAIDNLK